jgi:predicted phosphohydrolase
MRFAIISDTHFYAPGRGKNGIWWNHTLQTETDEIGRRMVEAVSETNPDFVVHCGDISGTCDMENYNLGAEILDQLPCPWYAVVGNHDTWYPGVRDAFSDRFNVPHGQCFHSVALGGLRFLFLDCCYWETVDGDVSPYLDKELFDSGQIKGLYIGDEQLAWLDGELTTHKDERVVLVSHAPLGFKEIYPVVTLPNGSKAPPEGCPLLHFNARCGVMGDIGNRLAVRELLAKHSNVRMALAGHCHVHDHHVEDGIAFIQTAAMREFPCEFRVVDVDNGVAAFTTHGLKDPSYSKRSYIEERNNSWVAGKSADRTFTIAL